MEGVDYQSRFEEGWNSAHYHAGYDVGYSAGRKSIKIDSESIYDAGYRQGLKVGFKKVFYSMWNSYMEDVMQDKDKPTKEQFEDYVRIQMSGIINMWAVRSVCNMSCTGLTSDICLYIMAHYEELEDEYGAK